MDVSHSDIINVHFSRSADAMKRAADDTALRGAVAAIADAIAAALRAGRKVLIAGNGGSAADAQHIAAELVGRYRADRPALAAIALTTDTSALTSIANDYGFERVFARQVEALGSAGDVFLAISTSGKSPNIVAAIAAARAAGLIVVGFTGATGGEMRALCDHLLAAPSEETSIVQQIHGVAAHAICDAVERALTASGAR
jgi:D-sedoheptulose 7-phosphate isomerase